MFSLHSFTISLQFPKDYEGLHIAFIRTSNGELDNVALYEGLLTLRYNCYMLINGREGRQDTKVDVKKRLCRIYVLDILLFTDKLC